MSETDIVKGIQLDHSVDDTRLFRNNVGEAWVGHAHRCADGSIAIHNPRRIKYGLCVGSGDLIGFKSLVITPEMVGQKIAIFTSIEVKSKRGRKTYEQESWLEMVRAFGGIAGVAQSSEETAEILAGDPDRDR